MRKRLIYWMPLDSFYIRFIRLKWAVKDGAVGAAQDTMDHVF